MMPLQIAVQFDALVSTGEASPPSFKASPAAPPSSNPCFGETSTKYPIDSTNFNDATTRFVFAYGASTSINLATTPVKVRADFTKFQSSDLSTYYETSWGAPVSSLTVLEVQLGKL